MKRALCLAMALFFMSLAPAFADTFSFSFNTYDNLVSGSGTLVAAPNGDGTFTVTGVSGTANGLSLGLVLNPTPPGVVLNGPANTFYYDDQLLPGQGALLTRAGGLLFSASDSPANGPSAGQTLINLYAIGSGYGYSELSANGSSYNYYSWTNGPNATFTVSAVPIPPSLLMLAPGLLGFVGMRRRFSKV
jgi:hypothetical protein